MTMKANLPGEGEDEMSRMRLEPDYLLQDSAGLQEIPCRATADPPLCVGTDKAEEDRHYEAVVQFKYDYLGRRVEFKYDYARRRVEKKVLDDWTGTSGTTIANLKYVYDGHNLIAELDASTTNKTVLSTYVWGLDLSGTMWGAGGVGGLLMVKDGTKTYFPAYDGNGNGNVSALIDSDSTDGALAAKYEYGAFGEPLRVSGTVIAHDNPFRYSTKYSDEESGLVYYGFRYYSPSLGRFLNRDPIGEEGGTNLYAFVENDPVNGWDYLGMDIIGEPASCESQCTSYSAEFEYRSSRECMEDRCPGLLLDDFEVKENKVRNWGGQSTNLGLILSAGGGGGDGGGPSGDDGCKEKKQQQEKNWKPSKEDCAELAKVWGRYINSTPHETRFDSQDEAAIAALFHTMLNFDTTKVEYGGNIYSDWSLWKTPSLHFGTYHFFGTPQKLKKYGGSVKRDVTIWQTIETNYHTHIINEPGSDLFSPTDKYGAWRFGRAYMGNETGTMKVCISEGTPSNVKVSYDIFGRRNVERGHFPGYSVSIEGTPTKATFQRIKKCRDEGYL